MRFIYPMVMNIGCGTSNVVLKTKNQALIEKLTAMAERLNRFKPSKNIMEIKVNGDQVTIHNLPAHEQKRAFRVGAKDKRIESIYLAPKFSAYA